MSRICIEGDNRFSLKLYCVRKLFVGASPVGKVSSTGPETGCLNKPGKQSNNQYPETGLGGIEDRGLFKAWRGDVGDLLRWDEARCLTNRLRGFLDIWRLSLDVDKHYSLLERIFGTKNLDQIGFSHLKKIGKNNGFGLDV